MSENINYNCYTHYNPTHLSLLHFLKTFIFYWYIFIYRKVKQLEPHRWQALQHLLKSDLSLLRWQIWILACKSAWTGGAVYELVNMTKWAWRLLMMLLEKHFQIFCSVFPGVKTLNNLISSIYFLRDAVLKKFLHWNKNSQN